jgi:DNA-binding transcriptional MerR regulator
MSRDGLLIGDVAAKSGVTRKALRLYEQAGILPPARRTAAGHRVYSQDTLAVLVFITQARRLGFRLDEIKRITTLKRSRRALCSPKSVRDKCVPDKTDRTSVGLFATGATSGASESLRRNVARSVMPARQEPRVGPEPHGGAPTGGGPDRVRAQPPQLCEANERRPPPAPCR